MDGPDLTNSKTAISISRRCARLFKWASLFLVVVVVLLSVTVGFMVAPDLFGNVPIPDAVSRIAREKRPATKPESALPKSAENTEETSWAFVDSENNPIKLDSEFIPNDPSLPPAILLQRKEINDDYTSITRALILVRIEVTGMSYEDSTRRLTALWGAVKRLSNRIYPAQMNTPQGKEAWKERVTNPHLRQLRRTIANLSKILIELDFDNLIRHEKWDKCAARCELDQCERWPEAVYYWRRQGGLKGAWHIVGGALYWRTMKYPFLDSIRPILPYQGVGLGADEIRAVQKMNNLLKKETAR